MKYVLVRWKLRKFCWGEPESRSWLNFSDRYHYLIYFWVIQLFYSCWNISDMAMFPWISCYLRKSLYFTQVWLYVTFCRIKSTPLKSHLAHRRQQTFIITRNFPPVIFSVLLFGLKSFIMINWHKKFFSEIN